jgi:hypothetical protein
MKTPTGLVKGQVDDNLRAFGGLESILQANGVYRSNKYQIPSHHFIIEKIFTVTAAVVLCSNPKLLSVNVGCHHYQR